MSVRSVFRRLKGSVRTSAFERDMEAELRHHLELETDALIARGMSPTDARDAARRRFGSVALVKDDCRESRGIRALDMLMQDIRFALRNLRKYPSYTAVVLLTLGLGIGANTAIFSVVHAVLLRPLPYAHGDRLVEVRQQQPKIGVANTGVSVKEILDYRSQTDALDAVVEYHQMSFNLLGRGEASRVQTGVVSANFFDVLGVTPMLGRTFRQDDDSKNAPAVLILSYAYWQNALGGDPGIIGRTFEMNDRVHTVVGVLPPVPQFPESNPPNDVYMPPAACPFRSNPQTIENRNARMLTAIGRLKPGATLERARNDLAVVTSRLGAEYPEAYDAAHTGFTASALSVHDELTREARPTLLVLLATTGFVLLLVSANIANLALSRVLGRERELALRSALGAGRGRIARQLLTESTLLAVAGGALGLLVGWLVRDLLVAFTARFTPRAAEIGIDGVVLAFTFAVSVCTGLLFGLLPAFTRRATASVADAGHRTVGSRRLGARNALIVAQVAISFVLLVGAGLLVRSFIKLQQVDAGFRTDRVLTALVSLDFVKYNTPVLRRAFYRAVMDKVAAEPGLESAAFGISVPLDQAAPFLAGFIVEGQAPGDRRAQPQVDFKFASTDYFKTIGMTLLSGRAFTDADDANAPPVGIVNLSMARHNFPDVDPVGRRVSLDNGRTWIAIVGVVNDTHDYGMAAKPTDELYRAFAQTGPLNASLLVRTASDPGSFARRIPIAVHDVDSRQPVSQIRTLDAIRSHSLAPPRLTAMLVALFAAVALIITAAGIAGVVSFSVHQRTTEIGVRMALGAPRSSVVGMIVRQGLAPVTIGLACGLAGALGMTRIVARLLFAVEPTDPITYGAVIATLAAVAAVACLVPARRAAAIDPMRALRAD
ncbi:MAG: transporter, permease protein [Acidobacteria bacterium]|nr:transporter, permease protein [Acidobacteriota bacterium]